MRLPRVVLYIGLSLCGASCTNSNALLLRVRGYFCRMYLYSPFILFLLFLRYSNVDYHRTQAPAQENAHQYAVDMAAHVSKWYYNKEDDSDDRLKEIEDDGSFPKLIIFIYL